MDLKEQNACSGQRHPWELARAAYLLRIVQQYQHDTDVILDIGSGDNFFNQHLSKYQQLYAVDTAYPTTHSVGRIIYTPDIGQVEGLVDLILALDVGEHQADDQAFFKQLKSKLKPSGKLIITVPADPTLYSGHDRFLGHYRRYSPDRLAYLAEELGFKIVEQHAFFWSLYSWRKIFPPAPTVPAATLTSQWPYGQNHLITKMVVSALSFDLKLAEKLRPWINLPGLSLLAVWQPRPTA